MMPTASTDWDLSHFWEAPHRPLFLAAFFCALATIAWWPLGVSLGLPAPQFEPVVLWHVHELVFGFVAAAMAGYLLTALPNWTGLPLLRGAPLKLLLLFWLVSRLTIALADHLPLWLLHIFNTGFFLLLAGVLCHQFLLARRFHKSWILVVVLAIGCAEAVFLHTTLEGSHSASLNLARTAVIGITLLMTVIGSQAIPAFTNNWFMRCGRTELLIPAMPAARNLTTGLMVLAMLGMTLTQFDLAYGALICAALTLLWIMSGWRTATSLRNPLLAAQHLAFLWLPVGQIAIAILWFFPEIYPLTTALHTLTIGAMSGLIMAIAGRAAAHQGNGDMQAGKGFMLGALMMWVTTCVRLAAPLAPHNSHTILTIAAMLWCLSWGVFIAGFLPAICGPVVRPVLSGKKHPTATHLPSPKPRQ